MTLLEQLVSDTRPRIVQPSNSPPNLSNHSFLALSARLSRAITRRPDRKVQPAPQMRVFDLCGLEIVGRVGSGNQTARLFQYAYPGRDVPFPTASLPPYVETAHSRVGQIHCGTAQAPYPVYHSSLAISPSQFGCHVDKAVHLSVEISIRDVSPVLSPLAGEDALPRSVGGHRTDRLAQKWQSRGLVQPGSFACASGEELVKQGRKDDSNDGLIVEDESDADAEHGKCMCEVDSTIERINDPRRFVCDQVGLRGALRVCLFSDKGVLWIFALDCRVNKCFDVCSGVSISDLTIRTHGLGRIPLSVCVTMSTAFSFSTAS